MVKRLFDILSAMLGLIILSPLLMVIAVLVKLSSQGAIIYGAKRCGKHGKMITVYKFRTMVVDADKIGAGITTHEDSRVTEIGRILRKYKIDELPQLWNVLTGSMSIVGPRPEDPRYVALYTPQQREILSIRPGITSKASIEFRDEESLLVGDNWEQIYIEHVLPKKIAIDLEYLQHASLWQDMVIIFQTFVKIVR